MRTEVRCRAARPATIAGAIWPLLVMMWMAWTPAPVAAQVTIEWDHGKCGFDAAPIDAACTPVFQVTAQAGEKIMLQITGTCPDLFNYAVVPIPRPAGAAEGRGGDRTTCAGTRDVEIAHDAQYGGYIVYVTKKGGTAVNVGEARVTISVKTSEWNLAFGGGFTASGLTSPAYALRQIETTDATGAAVTRYQLTEQNDRKDAVNRSVASFVHLHHSTLGSNTWGYPGLSFGLGLDPDRGGEYYLGPSWLFGDRATLTGGVVLGEIASLPSGRRLGDTITDANALANLGTRRALRGFLGISYSFLGSGRSDLQKPFLGATPPQTAAAAPAAPAAREGEEQGTAAGLTATIAAGDKQRGAAGAVIPVSVVVTRGGRAAGGAKVEWKVSFKEDGDDPSVTPVSAVTDAGGKATANVTVGSKAGQFKVTATPCVAAAPPQCTGSTAVEFTINPSS